MTYIRLPFLPFIRVSLFFIKLCRYAVICCACVVPCQIRCGVWCGRGWSDVNECAATVTPPSCSNGGVCTNTAGNFTCDCAGTGYSGDTCATGELRGLLCVSCLHLVCRASRSPVCAALVCCCLVVTLCFTLCVRCTVLNGVGAWFLHGWSDVNECAATVYPASCKNGGECSNTEGSFTCDCAGTGYSGATCATGEWRTLPRFSLPPLVFYERCGC